MQGEQTWSDSIRWSDSIKSDSPEQIKQDIALEQIVESRDVERVMQEIHEKYGFWVTPEYADDLIALVDALVQEDPYRAGL